MRKDYHLKLSRQVRVASRENRDFALGTASCNPWSAVFLVLSVQALLLFTEKSYGSYTLAMEEVLGTVRTDGRADSHLR